MPIISYTKEIYAQKFKDEMPLFNQTIRPAGKRVYKVGQILYHYTGPYRKGERVKIGESVVSEVVPIRIGLGSINFSILREGVYLSGKEIAEIAIDDGFKHANQMILFFISTYNIKPGDGNEFTIVKWRDFVREGS